MHRLAEELKLDFLTPTKRGFQPQAVEYVCHWRVDGTPQALSDSRRLLLRRADSEFVLFVDDDIEFGPEHVKILLDKMAPGIGAVESNPQIPGFPVKRSERVTRGWTGLTLLRVEACKGWSPPVLMRFEDEHLRRHVLHNGFRWVRALDCKVIHHAEARGVPGPSELHYQDGYDAWKVLPFRSKLWMIVKTPLFLRHGTPRFKAHLSFVRGMLNCWVDDFFGLIASRL